MSTWQKRSAVILGHQREDYEVLHYYLMSEAGVAHDSTKHGQARAALTAKALKLCTQTRRVVVKPTRCRSNSLVSDSLHHFRTDKTHARADVTSLPRRQRLPELHNQWLTFSSTAKYLIGNWKNLYSTSVFL